MPLVPLTRRLLAELIGTFWLVFGGCGAAVLAAAFPNLGIGFLGVALAFGLTVLTMAYAIGHISGCHLNPAVSIGLWAGKRFPARDLGPYIVAQVIGAIIGAGVLLLIASGKAGFDLSAGFATNGYAEHSTPSPPSSTTDPDGASAAPCYRPPAPSAPDGSRDATAADRKRQLAKFPAPSLPKGA
jgi:glycerol uptake facilitator-like aquaporin